MSSPYRGGVHSLSSSRVSGNDNSLDRRDESQDSASTGNPSVADCARLLSHPIPDLFNFHKQHRHIATIGAYQKNYKIDLGIIKNDTDKAIIDYIEKPIYAFTVSMGIYVFEMDVLHYIEPNKYLDFPDLVKRLLADGQKVGSYPFDGYWLDIGNHSDYETATEEFEAIKGRLHLV